MRQGIMLCYPFEEKRLAKWNSPVIVQPKLDGDRCRALIDDEGKVTLLSSEENIISSVPHINEALSNLHLRNVELDGELYVHGAPHEDIHSIVSRQVNLHDNSRYMEYHIFDIITEREDQVTRTSKLQSLFLDVVQPKAMPRIPTPLVMVPHLIAHDTESIMSALDYYVGLKYEGIIVRHPGAVYVRKRSVYMMKFKPRKEDIYEIIGVQQEMDKYGNPKESLGAFVCRGDDETLFNVGSGSLLTREFREQAWKEQETYKGKYAVVKYQHITSKGRVPRFPVIVNVIDNLC